MSNNKRTSLKDHLSKKPIFSLMSNILTPIKWFYAKINPLITMPITLFIFEMLFIEKYKMNTFINIREDS